MSQTVDEIAETLNTMRNENEQNSKNFEKVLTGINAKLELLSEDANADTIRLYVSELKKIIEDKSIAASIKFDEVQKDFLNLISFQKELAKEEDVKILFNSFNSTFEKFLLETQNRKEILENIENKVATLDIKTVDKNEIIGMVQNFSNDLVSMNNSIENSFLEISKDIKNINFSEDFEQLSKKVANICDAIDSKSIVDSVNDIRISFENNSKMNYENLVNEINNLKTEIISNINANDNSENVEKINSTLNDLIANVQFLMDLSSQNSTELSDNILNEIESAFSKLNEDFSSISELNFGNIKTSLDNINNNITKLKKDIIDSENSKTFVISNGFNNIKGLLENIPQMLGSVQNNIIQIAGDNSANIAETVKELASQIDDVKTAISNFDSLEKVNGSLGELSDKIENLNNGNSENNINEIKDLVSKLSSELNLAKFEYEQSLKEFNEQYSNQLGVVSDNIGNIKQYIKETVTSVEDYIKEAEQISTDNREIKYTDLSNKLASIENALVQSVQDYEYKFENLQSKLSEFVQLIEGSGSDTEGKIASSLEEIRTVKEELQSLSEILKSVKISNDEKSNESISIIDAGVENIILNLSNISEEIKKGSEDTVKKLIENSENKFSLIKDLVSELNGKDYSSEILNKISETSSALNSELKLISTDISEALQMKTEDMVRAFDAIKEGIDQFAGFDIERIVELLKNQLESSFLNFGMDVNKELISHSQSFSNLEQAYKISLDKIATIEECVTEKIQNDIELININLEKGIYDLKSSLGGNFSEQLQGIQDSVDSVLSDNRLIEAINGIKKIIFERLETFNNTQNLFSAKQDEIQDNIDRLSDNIKTFVDIAAQKIIEESKSEKFVDEIVKLHDKESIIADSISEINAKLDVIVSDPATEELNLRFDNIENADSIFEEKLSEIDAKLNVLATDSSSDEINIRIDGLEDVSNHISGKIDDLKDFNSQITEKFNVLDAKLNVLATDTSSDEINIRIDDLEDANNLISDKIDNLNTKLNIIATDTVSDDIKSKLDEISEKSEKMLSDYTKDIAEKLDTLKSDNSVGFLLGEISDSEKVISDIVNSLNAKVDAIATDDSLDSLLFEIDDVKNIIFEQHKNFETSSDEKLTAIDKYLKDVLVKLEAVDIDKNAEDIKETVMNALISAVDQISFVEESEDIKDFVEERTDEINKNIIEVQNQLKQLSTSDDAFDYTYTLQDVESDIAKLRMAMNNLQSADYTDLSDEIKRIVDAVNSLETSLTKDEKIDLKASLENLNEDILSISSRTNKILLNSDESFRTMANDLKSFRDIIYRLEDGINNIGNSEITSRIEQKLDRIQSFAAVSANTDKIFHQALLYIGEWVDATTEDISSISDKVSHISEIEDNLKVLKNSMPDKYEIIDEIKELLPDNKDLIGRLVSKFQLQEERIDILENKLEKILSTLEEKNDTVLTRKMDKIEKMLSKLGTNIEKLTSYVDEE